jgi:Holliday junction resolvasome RuvABC endonuclease subunit
MTLIVAGLDLALGHTGWAHVAYEDGRLLAAGEISPPASWPLSDRLDLIAARVGDVVTESVGNVFIERPIAHRSGTTTIRLGMVHGVVRRELGGGPPIVEVGITEVKKWATGKGNATKDDMVAAAADRFGRHLTHNEADAALIAAWGREQIIAAVESHPTGGGAA